MVCVLVQNWAQVSFATRAATLVSVRQARPLPSDATDKRPNASHHHTEPE